MMKKKLYYHHIKGQAMISTTLLATLALLTISASLPVISIREVSPGLMTKLESVLHDLSLENFGFASSLYCSQIIAKGYFGDLKEISMMIKNRMENQLNQLFPKGIEVKLIKFYSKNFSESLKDGSKVKNLLFLSQEFTVEYNVKIRDLIGNEVPIGTKTFTVIVNVNLLDISVKKIEYRLHDLLIELKLPQGFIPMIVNDYGSDDKISVWEIAASFVIVIEENGLKMVTKNSTIILLNRPWARTEPIFSTDTNIGVNSQKLLWLESDSIHNPATMMVSLDLSVDISNDGNYLRLSELLRRNLSVDEDLFKNKFVNRVDLAWRLVRFLFTLKDHELQSTGHLSSYEERLFSVILDALSISNDAGLKPYVFETRAEPVVVFLVPLKGIRSNAYVWSGCAILDVSGENK